MIYVRSKFRRRQMHTLMDTNPSLRHDTFAPARSPPNTASYYFFVFVLPHFVSTQYNYAESNTDRVATRRHLVLSKMRSAGNVPNEPVFSTV